MMERSRFTDRSSPGFSGLRAVAVLEAAKGIIVLLLGLGLFTLVHADLDAVAEEITAFLHVNPEGRFSRVFLSLADHTTSRTLWLLATGALVYSAVRFTEAYGLWHRKEWAQWFALLSGALYLPGELYSLLHHSNLLKWTIFATNTMIVLWIFQLRVRDRR
jgi:uncharacterized membrane protein (DUF2068 family)